MRKQQLVVLSVRQLEVCCMHGVCKLATGPVLLVDKRSKQLLHPCF
jgi:hypothetical protein